MAITGEIQTSHADEITLTLDRLSAQFLLRHMRGEVVTINPSPVEEFTTVLESTLQTKFGGA